MDIPMPDKNCSICKGSGRMHFKEKKTVCECVVRKAAKNYLGPLYAEVQYTKKLNFGGTDRFVCFERSSLEKFKALVKSFLLHHKLKLTHMSVFPQDIIQYYVTDGEVAKQRFGGLTEVDFLVIYFIKDPPNKLYGDILESILEKRVIFDKITWLYCIDSYEEFWFTMKYGKELCDFLNDKFFKFETLDEIVFEKGCHK